MDFRKSHPGLGLAAAAVLFISAALFAQDTQKAGAGLSVYFEELTAPDFVQAVAKSEATCIIPVGILEKHGPHLPLGTDLIDCREVARRAAAGIHDHLPRLLCRADF